MEMPETEDAKLRCEGSGLNLVRVLLACFSDNNNSAFPAMPRFPALVHRPDVSAHSFARCS